MAPSENKPTAPSLALANHILSCETFDQLATDVLPCLTRFFDAGSSCVFEMRRDGDDKLLLGRAAQIRMPIRAIADYSAHFVDLDPVCAPSFGLCDPRALAPNVHKVVRLSDRCTSGALLGTEYYNEFLRAIDVQHVFGLMVRPEFDPSRVVVLGFHRPRSGRDFSFELEQADALAPAFHASVERMCFRSRLDEAAETTAREREWSLRFASDARLLELTEITAAVASAPTRGSLCFPALLDALRRVRGDVRIDGGWSAMLSDLGIRGVVGGGHLCVTGVEGDATGHRFHLRVTPPLAVPTLERWAQGARLTARELDVTRRVVRGLRNVDVACELDLSLRTVENHLRSIFMKAGVRSRTQLLAQLVEPVVRT
ncbi:regulatory LuxR family protein [Panacagrimonas perspica]|uniref:Regulatory LuxR family protein n=1 Tax=Panacagrimonas perspica TaxID=381431 RepID=A0A4V6RR48_9GAMM|nr:helix-turn-helix transcriptional regulator [Panacagrimonas perspica]TDU32420.1 regulatory LuxR family protein [Panacagrimonas perspica]THD05341.1 hypothetical protein B1810_00960 [Panacagrimonas perspica]